MADSDVAQSELVSILDSIIVDGMIARNMEEFNDSLSLTQRKEEAIQQISDLIREAEKKARIQELEWWSVYAVQQDEPLFNAIVQRLKELKNA